MAQSRDDCEGYQTGELSLLDFLICKRLDGPCSTNPHTALLSGPPRCGKTSLLLQLAFNVVSDMPITVVFLCKPRNFEGDYTYVAQGVDTTSEVFDRIHIKYIRDDKDLRNYFAAFHMLTSLPTTVIVDDFLDFFKEADVRHQSGPGRSSRELAIVKTLSLAYSAISHASDKHGVSTPCRLVLSESHHGEGPRLLYIFRRWVRQTFVIQALQDSHLFTLGVHNGGSGTNARVAKYSLSQGCLHFDGWGNCTNG